MDYTHGLADHRGFSFPYIRKKVSNVTISYHNYTNSQIQTFHFTAYQFFSEFQTGTSFGGAGGAIPADFLKCQIASVLIIQYSIALSAVIKLVHVLIAGIVLIN